jgi:hypothetical protein
MEEKYPGTSVCSHLLPASSIADFSTLKMEVIRSSETLVHIRSTRRHIPKDGILHSHSRENLKSYNGYIYSSKIILYHFSVLLARNLFHL